jgi:hypothetical protein
VLLLLLLLLRAISHHPSARINRRPATLRPPQSSLHAAPASHTPPPRPSLDTQCSGLGLKHPATLLQSACPSAAMTTIVANSPIPAQYAAPAAADGVGSSRTYAAIAPSTISPHNVTPNSKHSRLPDHNASPTSSSSDAALQQRAAEGKRSPLSYVV